MTDRACRQPLRVRVDQLVPMRLVALRALTIALGVGALFGCEAPAVGHGSAASGMGAASGAAATATAGVGGSTAADASKCSGGPSVAPTPLRRLTQREYDNAARDLLATQLQPGRDFPPDLPAGGFASNRGDALSQLGVEKLMLAAESLAADAARRLPNLLPCASTSADAACARQFFVPLARRAYRRSLGGAELDELNRLYGWGEANGGFAFGVQVVIERVLQSPHFVYHLERTQPTTDANAAAAPLTGLSVADRLAALIWHGLPDTALLDAAERGDLGTPEGVAAQAERLLLDPKGRNGVVEFFNQLLDVQKLETTEKSATTYPAYSAAVRAAMWEETATFVDQVVRQGDAKLETLLTSNLGLPTAELAPLYGVAPSSTLVPLDPLRRFGLLTHPSVLAVHAHSDQSSPVKRGAFIRARLLCAPLPDPPPTVNANPPVVDPSATTRQRFEQHRSNPSCAACHGLIDPVGFAFEQYDGMGLYRASEGGLPIDASGTLTGTDVDGPFTDAVQLAQRLATSKQVRDCIATQWLRFAVRRLETPADACSQERIHSAFGEASNLRQLLSAVVQSDAFRFKARSAP